MFPYWHTESTNRSHCLLQSKHRRHTSETPGFQKPISIGLSTASHSYSEIFLPIPSLSRISALLISAFSSVTGLHAARLPLTIPHLLYRPLRLAKFLTASTRTRSPRQFPSRYPHCPLRHPFQTPPPDFLHSL